MATCKPLEPPQPDGAAHLGTFRGFSTQHGARSKMADDSQDRPARKQRRPRAAAAVLPVGLGRQASAPRVEPWGLVVELRRSVVAPALLSRPRSERLGRALVEALYPQQAQRDALARAGHVLAVADGLMSADTFLTDVDVQAELREIATYLGRALPPAPREGEQRTPWLSLTDCFHAADKSDDMAAFATGLYDEAHVLSLCLPFFRAHFEHQGPEADPYNAPFADASFRPRGRKLDAALASALGVAQADIRSVALAALPGAGMGDAQAAVEPETALEFGKPGYEGELFTLALRWQRWLMDHYLPLLQEVFDAGLHPQAFSAPGAAARQRDAALPARARRETPALEAVVVERSALIQGDIASAVRAQAWRCLALVSDAPDHKPASRHAGRGNAFLLCAVLVALDQDDHPVQQLNFFHTTPFAADTLKDSAEHHAQGMALPLEWRYSLLHASDDELRLSVLESQELQVNMPEALRQPAHRRDH